MVFFFFCFKQKTAYGMGISDWSSDVCSSELRVVDRQKAATSVEAASLATQRARPRMRSMGCRQCLQAVRAAHSQAQRLGSPPPEQGVLERNASPSSPCSQDMLRVELFVGTIKRDRRGASGYQHEAFRYA